MVVLIWKTGEDAVAKTVLGEIREAGAGVITAWPSRWLPPFGCGVMVIVVALRLIEDAKLGFGSGPGEAGYE